MAKQAKNLYRDAEARGELVAQPYEPEPIVKEEPVSEIVSDPAAFAHAVGIVQMEMADGGKDYVEVSESLFRYLVKNQKTPYLTYGDPGVKVFLEGTREECERKDALGVEEHYRETIKEKTRKLNERV